MALKPKGQITMNKSELEKELAEVIGQRDKAERAYEQLKGEKAKILKCMEEKREKIIRLQSDLNQTRLEKDEFFREVEDDKRVKDIYIKSNRSLYTENICLKQEKEGLKMAYDKMESAHQEDHQKLHGLGGGMYEPSNMSLRNQNQDLRRELTAARDRIEELGQALRDISSITEKRFPEGLQIPVPTPIHISSKCTSIPIIDELADMGGLMSSSGQVHHMGKPKPPKPDDLIGRTLTLEVIRETWSDGNDRKMGVRVIK